MFSRKPSKVELNPGDAFLFRYHSYWWQFFKRGYGGAKVIALEPHHDVVHLCILGQEDSDEKSIINHIPIELRHVLRAYEQDIPAEKPQWRDTSHAWEDLLAWRSAASAGEASAFDLPIGEALSLVAQTWSDHHNGPASPMRIASTFPVIGTSGSFTGVRIVEWESDETGT